MRSGKWGIAVGHRRFVTIRPMQGAIEWETTAVLIVAVRDELHGVENRLKQIAIAAPKSDTDLFGIYYLRHADNVLIRVLLAKLPDPSQGGDAAAYITTRLLERYKPYFLAMVGLCAGDPRVLRFGDVVVASATVRHDHGKLETQTALRLPYLERFLKPRTNLKMTHRHAPLKVPDHLARRLSTFPEARYPSFKTRFGVMATGNQVIKVSGAFDYLRKHVMAGAQGDEYHRVLLALEMEAHAVAYAADKFRVPNWLVVKGVCDHADHHKSDEFHEESLQNALTVTLDILNDVISEDFLNQEDRKFAKDNEEKAQRAFQTGDLSSAREAAKCAHMLGRRTAMTRRRYLVGLTQFAEYDAARRTIAEYHQSLALYDHTTREAEARMLWRQGQYEEACQLLSDDVTEGHRQLLYLRAMCDLLMEEKKIHSSGADPAGFRNHIERARDLLIGALSIPNPGEPPWWIMVNLVLVQRLLKADASTQLHEYNRANFTLRDALRKAPDRGTPQLYLLLLLAIAGRRTEFDEEVRRLDGASRHVQVALEAVDMVYERIEILYRRGDLLEHEHYWTGICRWLRQTKTIGRPVRDATVVLMQ